MNHIQLLTIIRLKHLHNFLSIGTRIKPEIPYCDLLDLCDSTSSSVSDLCWGHFSF